jgi:hypothetical protein
VQHHPVLGTEVRGAVTERDAPFELDGVVRWRSDGGPHEPGMGIEFLALREEMRDRLLELINAIAYLDDA